MNIDLILTEIVLWTITILSALIAHAFYISKDGKLRVIIISLFIAKIWVYGGSALYFLIFATPDRITLIRVIGLNAPMFMVMLRLWKYIRTKE